MTSEKKYLGSEYTQVTAMPKIKGTVLLTYIITAPVVLGVYNFVDFNLPTMPTIVDRVVFMTRWQFLTILTFLHMLQFALHKRGTVAWNPMNPATVKFVEVENRVLTNSVEQLILFLGTTIILTTYLKENQMALIPILIITWCFGRLLFGYGTIAIFIAVILGIYNFVDFNLPAMPTMVDRVVFMTRWHFLTVLTFLHMLQFVLYKRGTVAWNPMNPTTAHLVEVENRVLTNSVEQLILFVGTTTILTTYLEESRMALIPILIITWCFGRLLFGYG
ncbi:hypothetical protein TCAL_04531 [Tigriopus californicus]|uniref:Uncharacterized protein n=1 Tax=Tigriopus californicus TaxID=6832 RepID=A0A553PAX0_TIGCA|nr:hypothetical protein TCAL_04531 [Tigriopus californicus]